MSNALIFLDRDGYISGVDSDAYKAVTGETRLVDLVDIDNVICKSATGSIVVDEINFICMDGKPILCRDKKSIISLLDCFECSEHDKVTETWFLKISLSEKDCIDIPDLWRGIAKIAPVWDDIDLAMSEFNNQVKIILREQINLGVKFFVEV